MQICAHMISTLLSKTKRVKGGNDWPSIMPSNICLKLGNTFTRIVNGTRIEIGVSPKVMISK